MRQRNIKSYIRKNAEDELQRSIVNIKIGKDNSFSKCKSQFKNNFNFRPRLFKKYS